MEQQATRVDAFQVGIIIEVLTIGERERENLLICVINSLIIEYFRLKYVSNCGKER